MLCIKILLNSGEILLGLFFEITMGNQVEYMLKTGANKMSIISTQVILL